MSVIATAVTGVYVAAANASLLLTETTRDVEFDENKVTPGPGGFFATAAIAIAVIALGFLLVRRIRRISIRAEVRERIAEEQAANTSRADETTGPARPAEHNGPLETPEHPAGN